MDVVEGRTRDGRTFIKTRTTREWEGPNKVNPTIQKGRFCLLFSHIYVPFVPSLVPPYSETIRKRGDKNSPRRKEGLEVRIDPQPRSTKKSGFVNCHGKGCLPVFGIKVRTLPSSKGVGSEDGDK